MTSTDLDHIQNRTAFMARPDVAPFDGRKGIVWYISDNQQVQYTNIYIYIYLYVNRYIHDRDFLEPSNFWIGYFEPYIAIFSLYTLELLRVATTVKTRRNEITCRVMFPRS